MTQRKKICLCGSTRFKRAFLEWNARLTLEGNVVLSVAMHGHKMRTFPPPEQKAILDDVNLAKIDLADEVFVLDVKVPQCPICQLVSRSMCCACPLQMRPYIGDSTRREIAYAEGTGKRVRYLSVEHPTWTEVDCLYVED